MGRLEPYFIRKRNRTVANRFSVCYSATKLYGSMVGVGGVEPPLYGFRVRCLCHLATPQKEAVGFEPTVGNTTSVFKTVPLSRFGTPPINLNEEGWDSNPRRTAVGFTARSV